MTLVWVKTWYVHTKNKKNSTGQSVEKTKNAEGTLANVKGTGKMNVLVPIVQVLIHQWRTSFSSCILCGCVKWHQRSMCRAVSFIELLCNVMYCLFVQLLCMCVFLDGCYWSKLGLMYAQSFWKTASWIKLLQMRITQFNRWQSVGFMYQLIY